MNHLQIDVVVDGVTYNMPAMERRSGESDSSLSDRAVRAMAAFVGAGELGKIESAVAHWST